MSDFGYYTPTQDEEPIVSDPNLVGRGVVLPPIHKVPEMTPAPIGPSQASGLHSTLSGLGNLGDGVFGFLEARILGIPLWAIGAGVAIYYFCFRKKASSYRKNRGDESEDDYGYED